MTRDLLAERAGISASLLARIEHGARGVRLDTLVRIATALRVSTDELLRDSLDAQDVCYAPPEPTDYFKVIRSALNHLEAEQRGQKLT
jgi:transcriptional regulator with XRE-family HTH domain